MSRSFVYDEDLEVDQLIKHLLKKYGKENLHKHTVCLEYSALHRAALMKNTESCRKLIELCPKLLYTRTLHDRLPLHLAVINYGVEICEMLVDQAVETVFFKDKQGSSPFFLAVDLGYDKICRLFLEKIKDAGIGIEKVHEMLLKPHHHHLTMFQFILFEGYVDILKAFIDHGVDFLYLCDEVFRFGSVTVSKIAHKFFLNELTFHRVKPLFACFVSGN